MKEEWSLEKLLKILIIVFLVFVIFALIFKGIVSIARGSKTNSQKKSEKIETTTQKAQQISDVTYNDLEDRIELAAERYQNDNYQGTLDSRETWILSYKMLKENKYMTAKLIDPNDNKECDGYVVFKKDIAKITYIPYIKCSDKYQTKGYDASLIE